MDPVHAPEKAGTLRLPEIDAAKGILLLLVICSHIHGHGAFGQWFQSANGRLFDFRMPAFLLISGFFAARTARSIGLGKWTMRLVVPYLVWHTIYALLLAWQGHNPLNQNHWEFTPGAFLHATLVMPLGVYWYTYALALFLLVGWADRKVAERIPGMRHLLVVAAVVAGEAFGLAGSDRQAYLWLGLGYTVGQILADPRPFYRPPLIILAAAPVLLVPLPLLQGYSGFRIMLVVGMVGTALWAARACEQRGRRLTWFEAFGRSSFEVYAMHIFFLNVIKLPLVADRLMAVDGSGVLHVVVSLAAGIGGPLAATWLLRRMAPGAVQAVLGLAPREPRPAIKGPSA